MFEYVRLKNYKSFGNIHFNLTDGKGAPKKLILIYGENGIGKSNLASCFYTLSETMHTMDVRDILQHFLEDSADKADNEEFSKFLREKYKDIETIIRECKMVNSNDNMYMEWRFRIDGKSGKYILETDNTQIVHERLEFILAKNRGAYYDITPEKTMISPKIFKTQKALMEIKFSCEKFWGKHSLLSILLHESDDKADQYIHNQISKNFSMVLHFFSRISCKIKFGSHQERGIIGLPEELLPDLEKGKISIEKENQLAKIAEMLTLFFRSTYKDIDRAYYKKEKKENIIRYQLMISKFIAGKLRDIDFSLESTGTQALIQQLPFMLVAVTGAVTVIDEVDTGIHDLLIKDLLLTLDECIDGQLIVTTHNTLLMECGLPKDCIYVINELENKDKEIQCITHYDPKINKNTNIRSQYMLGRYSGIPQKAEINFNELLSMLNAK